MSWWGKIVGGAFGFMLGGPLGAMLGAALGHNFDKGLSGLELPDDGSQERVQAAFFSATFSIMGHIAKADGKVTPSEIKAAQAVMQQMDLSAEHKKTAINLFNEGKRADFPLDEVLAQFRKECHRRITLMQMFLEIQFMAAYADGTFDSAEAAILEKIRKSLHIPSIMFEQLRQRAEAAYHQSTGQSSSLSIDDAYATLNVNESTPDKEIKKSYRRLISQHHPDKLVAKGLPEEMMKVAAKKTHEIKQAYETIKKYRKN